MFALLVDNNERQELLKQYLKSSPPPVVAVNLSLVCCEVNTVIFEKVFKTSAEAAGMAYVKTYPDVFGSMELDQESRKVAPLSPLPSEVDYLLKHWENGMDLPEDTLAPRERGGGSV